MIFSIPNNPATRILRFGTLAISLLFLNLRGHAQCAPLASAVPGITLVHQNTNCFNNSGVAYNPNLGLYYACRAGNSGFPYETWTSGGVPLFNTTTGFDFRGLWWNPTLNQLEGNGYNSAGIWRSNLNASGYALNTGAVVLACGQPNAQSCGDLDWQAYEILYYSAGNIYRYSRTTGAALGSYPITGTPVAIANLNSTTLMYTGCAGYEIALLDATNKRVYFYNKATGAYSGMSQLPATAITTASFRVSWANNLIWLFNVANYTWYSYQVLSSVLPVELISFTGQCSGGKAELHWSTASESDNDYFTVERTTDGVVFESMGKVEGGGNTSMRTDYSFIAQVPSTGGAYYRLKQTDFNGAFKYSSTIFVGCESAEGGFGIYPNPGSGTFLLEGCKDGDEVRILDVKGQLVYSTTIAGDASQVTIQSGLPAGVYMLQVTSEGKTRSKKLFVE